MSNDTSIMLPLEPTPELLHAIGVYIPLPDCERRRELSRFIYRSIIDEIMKDSDNG